MMKEAILMGELDRMGEILNFGWQNKKRMARGITNPDIDKIYDSAMAAGASGGKVSGAGGGGFIMFYCPGTAKHTVMQMLAGLGGRTRRFNFTEAGLTTWKI